HFFLKNLRRRRSTWYLGRRPEDVSATEGRAGRESGRRGGRARHRPTDASVNTLTLLRCLCPERGGGTPPRFRPPPRGPGTRRRAPPYRPVTSGQNAVSPAPQASAKALARASASGPAA